LGHSESLFGKGWTDAPRGEKRGAGHNGTAFPWAAEPCRSNDYGILHSKLSSLGEIITQLFKDSTVRHTQNR
jgi:hypothetical protein